MKSSRRLLSVLYVAGQLTLCSLSRPGLAQEEVLSGPMPETEAVFGWDVAVSNGFAIAGAYLDDPDGVLNAGAAYVFKELVGGSWSLEAQLLPEETQHEHDNFGTAVSVFGNTAIVGAFSDEGPSGEANGGSAFAFTRNAAGEWRQEAKLFPSTPAVLDGFGYSASLSGVTAIVGAWYFGVNPGSAYVFVLQDSVWVEQARLTGSDAGPSDEFGISVSVSGDFSVVGAPGHGGAGAAYVFERVGEAWIQRAKLTGSSAAFGDAFGRSVSIEGDTILVGANLDDDDVSPTELNAGSAYVFALDPVSQVWSEQAKLVASDLLMDDQFGFSVAVSESLAVIGAPRHDSPAGTGSAVYPDGGAVYVFSRDPAGVWSEKQKFVGSSASPEDKLGWSVATSDTVILGGAPSVSETGASGVVYVMHSAASSESVRVGVPPNPAALMPGVTSGPLIGSTWDPFIEHATFMPSAVLDFMAITASGFNLPLLSLGTLLCDPTFIVEIVTAPGPGTPFAIPIPTECKFAGVSICTQGASLSALGGIQLTNALDITIGTF